MTAYTKTNWVNDSPPDMNAANYNHAEQGVDDGHNELGTLGSNLVGIVLYYAANNVPGGWLKCNGSAVSRSAYSALFNVIGTTFGPGDGSTTFNLPDLRGCFIRGWDHGAGRDPGRVFGSYQDSDVKSHSHSFADDTPASTTQAFTTDFSYYSGSTGTNNRNTDYYPTTASDSRPKNIAMVACIRY